MRFCLHNWLHPITRKRLRRFRETRRAWWSFWLLAGLYAVSLAAELICNSVPLYVRFNDRSFFPVFRYCSEDDLLGNGVNTRAPFKQIRDSEAFRANPDNRMIFPLISHGPLEIIKPETIKIPDSVTVTLTPDPRVGTVDLRDDFTVSRAVAAGYFFGADDHDLPGRSVLERWALPREMAAAIKARFRNEESPAIAHAFAEQGVIVSLAAFSPRRAPPSTVRLTIRESFPSAKRVTVSFDPALEPLGERPALWRTLDADARARLVAAVKQRFDGFVAPIEVEAGGRRYRAQFVREEVRYPFRPVEGHPLGIDSAGRDVLARLLYGLRTSVSFGIILVAASMILGTMVGAAQGYHGGKTDLIGQRLIEIWDALPFLYIMMLVGSVYGRSFTLLLICYGLFNWIGISYYMRGEFLRLRTQPFVEAARCLALPSRRIIFRHILPNALVPIITFFPFSLVSAIFVLAALDFLGFGLPPPTPSWGEMLSQAQEHNWAWWLVVYPTLALFVVMLLGVFVGEGIRSAFDPRKYSRLE